MPRADPTVSAGQARGCRKEVSHRLGPPPAPSAWCPSAYEETDPRPQPKGWGKPSSPPGLGPEAPSARPSCFSGTERQDTKCADCPPGTFSLNGSLAECQPWTK